MAYTHTVRFSEVDAAGILFFSRVFEIAHAAYEALLAERGTPLRQLVHDERWTLPLVHAEADYHAPMRLGDEVSVQVAIEAIGSTSLTLRFTLAAPSGQPLATVRHVHVAVDRATFRPVPLPEGVRALHPGGGQP